MCGLQHLPLGKRQADGFHHLAQGLELFRARLLVHPVEQAQALFLQGLGGGDVGEDHEVLDQAMGVEPFAEGDGQHLAFVRQHDPPFRQVEVQRLALVPGTVGGAPSRPERADDGLEQRLGVRVGRAVGRGLRLGVAEGRLRAHQPAGEAVAALVAVGVEHDSHREAGPVDAVDQRAEIAREAVGEHRHDAVGEVGGVAAAAGLAVQRAVGADVGGDVGDGDPDDVAAGVGGVVVRLGADRVVVVAGIRWVDGDEGEGAQVLALAEGRRAGGVGFRQHGVGKGVGDAVLVDRDQRHRPRGGGVAEARDDAGAGQAVAAGRTDLLGLDQFAVAGAGAVGGRDHPVAVGALVDGGDPAAGLGVVIDADDPLRPHADAADHPGGEGGVGTLERGHPTEQPVAGAERGIVAAGEDLDARGRAVAFPVGGFGPEVAVGVGAGHPEHEDRRQFALRADLAAALLELALAGHAGEELLELDLGRALQAEGAGDLALAGLRRVVAQEGEDVVGGGKPCHGRLLARGGDGRHWENAAQSSSSVSRGGCERDIPSGHPPSARSARGAAPG